MKLIDASDLIKKHGNDVTNWGKPYAVCISSIENAKEVDATKTIYGDWREECGFTICSCCQALFNVDLKMIQVPSTYKNPKYCPNCGAKMETKGG